MNKLVTAIALSALLTACGTTENTEQANDAATTTTRTPRITDDSGRPDITFDPCLDIPDDLMNAAGYNAAKKKPTNMPMGTYTFFGCDYFDKNIIPGVRRGFSLIILSGNVTLDEERAKNGHLATETTINGRPALLEHDASDKESCTYVLGTDFGMVIISRILNSDHVGYAPFDEWCVGVEELVESIEPFIDRA